MEIVRSTHVERVADFRAPVDTEGRLPRDCSQCRGSLSRSPRMRIASARTFRSSRAAFLVLLGLAACSAAPTETTHEDGLVAGEATASATQAYVDIIGW